MPLFLNPVVRNELLAELLNALSPRVILFNESLPPRSKLALKIVAADLGGLVCPKKFQPAILLAVGVVVEVSPAPLKP